MAAPSASKIILPNDAGNTGKNVRTQTRVVGADTVHEHFFISTSPRSTTGIYRANSGIMTPPIAVQNGTSTGFIWLFNPIGSTIKAALHRAQTYHQFAALAVDLVPGEFRLSLFTYTGTPSGAAITPAKRDSTDAGAQVSVRSASTGMTVTLGATIMSESGPIMPLATGSGISCPSQVSNEWDPELDEQMILRAGEGIVWWSAQALTTANRRALGNFTWEEFE